MAAHTTSAQSKSADSVLINTLITAVLVLVSMMLAGGYWLKQQQSQAQLHHRAYVYDNYLQSTQPAAELIELPQSFVQAQERRKQLLSHPAVTPGAGFDTPGVHATGKAILDAIDQAKELYQN